MGNLLREPRPTLRRVGTTLFAGSESGGTGGLLDFVIFLTRRRVRGFAGVAGATLPSPDWRTACLARMLKMPSGWGIATTVAVVFATVPVGVLAEASIADAAPRGSSFDVYTAGLYLLHTAGR